MVWMVARRSEPFGRQAVAFSSHAATVDSPSGGQRSAGAGPPAVRPLGSRSMYWCRNLATLVRALGACVVLLPLLHACRDADRPTAGAIDLRAPRPAAQTGLPDRDLAAPRAVGQSAPAVRAASPQIGSVPEFLVGQWSSVFPAPVVQLHLHLLPNGKVLSWGHTGDPQVWDPTTSAFTAIPAPSLLFCAGHDFLPDGRLLVAGGHLDNDRGLPNTNVFDPTTNTWQAGPPMARGRWYPTNTTLPDGEMLTIGGRDESGTVVTLPEIWNGSGWRQLTTASLELPYYPRMFVAPDGRVFYAGEEPQSRYLSVAGTGSWTNGPVRQYTPWREYGSAVMYEPGKILYVGGGDPPTITAEIIDLNQPNPSWPYTASMAFARRQMNATLLPTGDVLVTGGTSGSGFNNPVGAVHAAELCSPATGAWTTLASNAVTRIYHSTTLLLPDARVLHTGSGDGGGGADERNYELYF